MLKNKGTKLVASVVTILLTIGMIGCGNVESSQEVNLDSTISEVAEASIGQSVAEEKTEKSTEATSEASVEASVEASTEASTEEKVEATTETSETTETVSVEAVANASTNTETVQSSTSGTLTGQTGPNGWPIIEYNGSADGKGPGLAWRDDYDYVNDKNIQGNFNDIIAFTASNGVTIKVVVSYNGDTPIYWPISDGKGKDLEPNSAWNKAINEAMYGPNGAYNATDLSANVNATLPNTSYKRTSIDPNDSQVAAYKQAYDYKRSTCDGGTYYPRPAGTINDSIFFFTDGVGEYDKKGVALWEFRNTGSYWSLVIYQNPAEYQWSGIKEVLEYLSPDGAALYAGIYDDFYVASYDNPIEAYDSWWPCGNSQIMSPDNRNAGHCDYYFK